MSPLIPYRGLLEDDRIIEDSGTSYGELALEDRATGAGVLVAQVSPGKQKVAQKPKPKLHKKICMKNAKYFKGNACILLYEEGKYKYRFAVTNTTHDYVFVHLELDLMLNNAKSSKKPREGGEDAPIPGPEIHEKLFLPLGNKEQTFLEVTRKNAKVSRFGLGRSSSSKINPGDPNATPDKTLYIVPFPKGEEYQCTRGFNEQPTHQGKYAADFDLKVGDSVTAARDGIVVEVKNDSGIVGSKKVADKKHWNYVRVRHQDGTYAQYGHLKKGGAKVKPGDSVKAGMSIIGESGNSGFSEGPHLHFEIHIADGSGGFDTVDWKFKNKDGNAFEPKTGETYKHE